MIDLRSDTFTMPTQEMRIAMANAEVGDDVFCEDPTINELEEYTANLLGKEAALFVSSGTMGNQLAIAAQTNPGDEIIVESDAHIFFYEAAAPAVISRVQPRCIASETGAMPIESVEAAIRGADIHFPRTSLICLENTHNRHGGTIISLDYIDSLAELAESKGIKLHCDGARLWETCAATGISPADYAKNFDTVTVCLSKGLGAPVGSVLASSREVIAKARKWRKMMGGGMRQAGIIAAGGLFAIKNHFPLIKETHSIARSFAESVSESEYLKCDLSKVQTNIVLFEIPSIVNSSDFVSACLENGLKVLPFSKSIIRAVFHFQISSEAALQGAEIAKTVIKQFLN